MIIIQKYTFDGPLNYNGIYAIKDPRNLNEYKYVGKTSRGFVRYREHSNIENNSNVNNYKSNWLKSLLVNGIKPHFELLEIVDPTLGDEGLNIAEKKWISILKIQGHPLTNCSEGGEGTVLRKEYIRPKRSLDSRRKQSEKMSREKHPFWGKPRDPDSLVKMSISKIGNKNPMYGISQTTDSKRKLAKSKGTKPFCDKKGSVYYTKVEAAEALGLFCQNIGQVLLGSRSHTKGHTFRYLTAEEIAQLESNNGKKSHTIR